MSQRILQINELLREHLGGILLREVSFKTGILVTITKVDTNPDLRRSNISVSVFPEKETAYALRTLEHEKRRIQKTLHGKLHMKPLPLISFRSDPTEQNADVIEKILLELK